MDGKDYDIVYPNAMPEGVALEKNVSVAMRDGVRMAIDIYKPAEGNGPWPAILAYSPFRKERVFESAKPGYYCRRGYVCVQAAERGIGFNQGEFSFHGPVAAQDGYDIIEWIASQPWCNGNVATMGASGYGVTQWITAALNPPHLKALVVLATTDNYRGLCYPGGVLRQSFVLYLANELIGGAIWPGPIAGKGEPQNLLAQILARNEDGPFWWEHGGGWRNVSQIEAPILNIVNTPNRLHAPSHLRSYADIKSPKKLVIAPWTAENYQPWIFETTAFNEHILRWLDYWLKGVDTGIMSEPDVAIYDNGTGQWRYEAEYPIARTDWQRWHLRSRDGATEANGRLSRAPAAGDEAPDVFYNISLNTAAVTSYGILEDKAAQAQARDAVYLSAPLEEDLRVWGPISLTLYAATGEEVTSDWSFFVKMGEMAPDGVPANPATGKPEIKPQVTDAATPREVQIWSWGCLKAKFREVDEELSRPGAPWHSFQRPADLKPNMVYEFQIELQPTFKTFKKRCRIWLKIACDDALYSTRDSYSRYVETPLAAENNAISIYHDSRHPSHVLLAVAADDGKGEAVGAPLRDAVPGAARFTA